jgi:lysophospholipase L1-like esterase
MLHDPHTLSNPKRLAFGLLLLLVTTTGLRPMPVSATQIDLPDGEQSDDGDLITYLPVLFRTVEPVPSKIYCMGDSLTLAGVYEIELIKLLGPYWVTIERGKSGDSTPGMLARFQTDVIDYGDAAYVIIWGGTNDIRWLTKEDTQTSLQAMYTLANNAGIKVVAVTITPQNSESALNKIKLLAINSWIQNTAKHIDYVADAYTAVDDPNNPGNILPAYDSGDHVHLSNAGYAKVAATIYEAVTWIPGP